MANEGLSESLTKHVRILVVTVAGRGPRPSTCACMTPVLAGAAGRRACAEWRAAGGKWLETKAKVSSFLWLKQGRVFTIFRWTLTAFAPKDHPIEKENHLNQTSIIMFHVNFPGCILMGTHNFQFLAEISHTFRRFNTLIFSWVWVWDPKVVFMTYGRVFYLGGGFKYSLCSTRNPGEMIQFDVRIFFKLVGSTTSERDGIQAVFCFVAQVRTTSQRTRKGLENFNGFFSHRKQRTSTWRKKNIMDAHAVRVIQQGMKWIDDMIWNVWIRRSSLSKED